MRLLFMFIPFGIVVGQPEVIIAAVEAASNAISNYNQQLGYFTDAHVPIVQYTGNYNLTCAEASMWNTFEQSGNTISESEFIRNDSRWIGLVEPLDKLRLAVQNQVVEMEASLDTILAVNWRDEAVRVMQEERDAIAWLIAKIKRRVKGTLLMFNYSFAYKAYLEHEIFTLGRHPSVSTVSTAPSLDLPPLPSALSVVERDRTSRSIACDDGLHIDLIEYAFGLITARTNAYTIEMSTFLNSNFSIDEYPLTDTTMYTLAEGGVSDAYIKGLNFTQTYVFDQTIEESGALETIINEWMRAVKFEVEMLKKEKAKMIAKDVDQVVRAALAEQRYGTEQMMAALKESANMDWAEAGAEVIRMLEEGLVCFTEDAGASQPLL